MPATIIDHVTSAMRIYDEETFGPCTIVVRAKDTEDAVRIANDTAYGLLAAVFGRDVTRALGVALRIDTGSFHVNGSTVQNEAQAHYGGTKDSVYCRFDGRAVIDEFTELKWITLEPASPTPSEIRSRKPALRSGGRAATVPTACANLETIVRNAR
jgi:salicylaldehyde dehydrogenase